MDNRWFEVVHDDDNEVVKVILHNPDCEPITENYYKDENIEEHLQRKLYTTLNRKGRFINCGYHECKGDHVKIREILKDESSNIRFL